MIAKVRHLAVLDCEVYKDYFLCKIRRLDNAATRIFELYDGCDLAIDKLRHTLSVATIITFNGRSYDMPIVSYALTGASCEQIKHLSDLIIGANMRYWEVENQFGFRVGQWDHIDLIEVVPGRVSLKVYMGRLHCPRMQDLPIEHTASILPEQRQEIIDYNENDLDGTAALYTKFKGQIELRESMSKTYGIDLRSKSDAQIAEAVIKIELQKLGVSVTKASIEPRVFKFTFAPFFEHAGEVVNGLIDAIKQTNFIVKTNGYVEMPKQLADARIKIGSGIYRMGIGGLHSSEQCQSIEEDDDYIIEDRDVASYYPAIVINTDLYPQHLSFEFLTVYERIRDQRIEHKHAGRKTQADTLKIVLNGAFGKFGNPWSILYAPELLIQVTLTGQLALLMLIEFIERDTTARVMSANTDGIVIKCPRSAEHELEIVLARWEKLTGFETEGTRYKRLCSRDVNSYIAFKHDGSVKLKGAYAESEPVASSWPSPHNQICITAVCDYIEHGVPLDLTISTCTDIRQMIEVRNVTGGGVWRGVYLGRAVRWYKSKNGEPIFYRKMNKHGGYNKVAGTDGCTPLMIMDGSIPDDIDIDAYVREAEGILRDIGFTRIQQRKAS